MAWRLAKSLEKLRNQINAAYPNRNKASDGTIGDAAHAASASDHNPNAAGVVCAMDITNSPATGFDAHALAEKLRTNRHPDLKYIISNKRIAGAWTNWAWQAYNGSNPHSSHIHISVGRGNDGQSTPPYDDTNDWAVSGTVTPPPANKQSNQEIANEVLAGKWGNNPQRRDSLIAAGYDYNAIQAIVNGQVGNPPAAPSRKSNAVIAQEVIAGAWGNNPERKQRLEAAGYNYQAVQDIVNGNVPAKPAAPARLSNEQVADQIIAGAWGTGDDRRNRLVGAGYDYNAVQSIVNQKMGQVNLGKKSNDEIANQVLQGQWGNNPERAQRLAAAGYDANAIQALVNRKLGF